MPRSLNFYYAALGRDDAAALLSNGFRLLTDRGRVPETAWREECQRLLASLTGSVSAYAFPSARAALLAILQALGIGRGDEVLVTGFTCVAVPAPVVYVGARPVYIDIHPRTFNMDVAGIEARISPRARAIIVQHTFGNPADTGEIIRIARRHGLYVIEDCALALGSRYAGRPVGIDGHAAIVSFELSKTVTAGWGGIAWINDVSLSDKVGAIHGRCRVLPRGKAARLSFQVALSYAFYHPRAYWIGRYLAALLYRTGIFRVSTSRDEARGRMPADYFDHLSDAHWRVVLNQIGRLDHIVALSQHVSSAYREVLAQHAHHTYPEALAAASPTWIRFPFLVADREGMKQYFARHAIEVGQWFDTPVSGASDLSVFGYTGGACPTAEFACRHVVNLPVNLRLSPSDVARIVAALDDYLTRHPENQEFAQAANEASGTLTTLPGAAR